MCGKIRLDAIDDLQDIFTICLHEDQRWIKVQTNIDLPIVEDDVVVSLKSHSDSLTYEEQILLK